MKEKQKSTAEKFEEALNNKLEHEYKGLAASENLTGNKSSRNAYSSLLA